MIAFQFFTPCFAVSCFAVSCFAVSCFAVSTYKSNDSNTLIQQILHPSTIKAKSLLNKI